MFALTVSISSIEVIRKLQRKPGVFDRRESAYVFSVRRVKSATKNFWLQSFPSFLWLFYHHCSDQLFSSNACCSILSTSSSGTSKIFGLCSRKKYRLLYSKKYRGSWKERKEEIVQSSNKMPGRNNILRLNLNSLIILLGSLFLLPVEKLLIQLFCSKTNLKCRKWTEEILYQGFCL